MKMSRLAWFLCLSTVVSLSVTSGWAQIPLNAPNVPAAYPGAYTAPAYPAMQQPFAQQPYAAQQAYAQQPYAQQALPNQAATPALVPQTASAEPAIQQTSFNAPGEDASKAVVAPQPVPPQPASGPRTPIPSACRGAAMGCNQPNCGGACNGQPTCARPSHCGQTHCGEAGCCQSMCCQSNCNQCLNAGMVCPFNCGFANCAHIARRFPCPFGHRGCPGHFGQHPGHGFRGIENFYGFGCERPDWWFLHPPTEPIFGLNPLVPSRIPAGCCFPRLRSVFGQHPVANTAPEPALPTYTTRGPRDFFLANPPFIGY